MSERIDRAETEEIAAKQARGGNAPQPPRARRPRWSRRWHARTTSRPGSRARQGPSARRFHGCAVAPSKQTPRHTDRREHQRQAPSAPPESQRHETNARGGDVVDERTRARKILPSRAGRAVASADGRAHRSHGRSPGAPRPDNGCTWSDSRGRPVMRHRGRPRRSRSSPGRFHPPYLLPRRWLAHSRCPGQYCRAIVSLMTIDGHSRRRRLGTPALRRAEIQQLEIPWRHFVDRIVLVAGPSREAETALDVSRRQRRRRRERGLIRSDERLEPAAAMSRETADRAASKPAPGA